MITQGLQKRWLLPTPANAQQISDIARHIAVPPIVAQLLIARGHDNPDAAESFLNPKLKYLHPPELLPQNQSAAQRIAQAVKDNQPITIYGDYDVDGVTASAILWHTLTAINARVSTYIPHRIDEGYGLNNDAIKQLCASPPDYPDGKPLIITVDCGITATEQAAIAKDAGVDMIITDHHQFDLQNLPDAFALLHPRLPDSDGKTYPDPNLCGAAVAFKLAWQTLKTHCGSERLPQTLSDLLIDLLSLAALGTIADVVPLHDENRLIATKGLGKIKNTCFLGLNTLIDASNLREQTIESYHVGFVLGPRINAAGRMGHASDALELLTDANATKAAEIAQLLINTNDQRQQTQREIFEQAKQMVIDAGYDQPHVRAIVLGCDQWHPGVVGIVASRIVEEFARPTVLLCYNEDQASGSARSIDEFNIHDSFQHCSKHLTGFGGHAMAAGLRLPIENVDNFRNDMIAYAKDHLTEQDLVQTIKVDATCDFGDITAQNIDQLNRLAPFGCENPSPTFCIKAARLQLPAKRMGSHGKHLQLTLVQNGIQLRAVAWNMGDLAEQLPASATIDIVGEAKINTWQGRRNPELNVRDLQII